MHLLFGAISTNIVKICIYILGQPLYSLTNNASRIAFFWNRGSTVLGYKTRINGFLFKVPLKCIDFFSK